MVRIFQRKRAKGFSWYVDWRDAEGDRQSKSCGAGDGGQRQAEKLKRQLEAEQAAHQAEHPDGEWKAPNDEIWVTRPLLDPHYQCKRPSHDPERYPQIPHPRLLRLVIDVPDWTSPNVLGRIRRIKDPNRSNGKLHHLGDAWEAADPTTFDHAPPRPINCTEGEWIDDEIYSYRGKSYVTIKYLDGRFQRPNGRPIVHRWRWWIDHPSPDLDPAVSDGKIRVLCVKQERCNSGVLVFLLDDAKLIVSRWIDAKQRQSLPGNQGEHLGDSGHLVDHPEYGVCVSDKYAIDRLGVPIHFCRRCRRQYQYVLGRKAHQVSVPPLIRGSGKSNRPFTCLADLKAVAKWRKELESAGTWWENPALKDALSPEEMARRLDLDTQTERIYLAKALATFRTIHPESCTRRCMWIKQDYERVPGAGSRSRKGSPRDTCAAWVYDLKAFRDWLATRPLREIAMEYQRRMRRHRNGDSIGDEAEILTAPAAEQRVKTDRVATEPLQRPDEEPKFRMRIAEFEDKAIEQMRQLIREQAPHIVKSILAGQANGEATPTANGEKLKKSGGRPISPKTQDMHEFCFNEYNKGTKLSRIRAQAVTLFGKELAPKDDGHVTTYAKRFSEKTKRPLTRPENPWKSVVHKTSQNPFVKFVNI